MKQVYYSYTEWEDYLNGMYDTPKNGYSEKYIHLAVELLSDPLLFKDTCINILNDWPRCSSVNLTNTSCNRKAWLGQAACNYKYSIPEICTRIAWGRLPPITQSIANDIAQKIIKSFEVNYGKQNKELY